MQLIPFGERSHSKGSAPRSQFRGHFLDEGRPPVAWRYIYLQCGHLTTPETHEQFRTWQPRKGVYRCESCCKWVKNVDWFTFHGIARPAETTEPMF